MRKRITKVLIAVAIISIMVLCFVACYVQNGNSDPQIEINSAGYWVINGETTTVKAQGTNGKDGVTPAISINNDGFWVINGETTTIKAEGKDGKDGSDGKNGVTPTISINQNGYWVINGTPTTVKAHGKDGVDGTNGKDGETPTISINADGYWVINGNVTDVKAQGKDGINGTDGKDGIDGTSINKVILDKNADDEPILLFYEELSDGTLIERCSINIKELCGKDCIDGEDGITPTISIDTNGYWVINGKTTEIKAQGTDGKNGTDGADGMDGKAGKNIFELYKEVYGYEGSIDEWLKDVLNGTLGSAKKHTVTFDYNGYTLLNGMPTSTKVIDGRTVSLPNLDRKGYIFLGWYVGNGINDGQWLNTLVVSSDLNLVARWQEKEFEVRFETATGELLKTEKVIYGNNATAPNAPHVEGCVFDGWDGETENITNNRILHPVYLNIRYTITYETNGGSSLPNETYLYNEIPTAPLSPTKSGYVFAGWKLENAEDTDLYIFNSPLTNDIKLFAVWSDTIIITDVEGLKAIGNYLNANYSLGRNINLNGEEWIPLGEFKGTFDGKGYKIYNFVMSTATSEMGFFTTNSGTIKNIVFSDVVINNTYEGGNTAIVSAINNGKISGINIKESIIQRYYFPWNVNQEINIGGISGKNNGIIKDSSIDFSAILDIKAQRNCNNNRTSYTYYGGIAGTNNNIIENVDVKSQLTYKGTATSNDYYTGFTYIPYSMTFYSTIGGAVGNNHGNMNLIKTNIISELSFIGSGNGPIHYRRIGGVVGENKGDLTNSYSIGSMSMTNSGTNIDAGTNSCGGLVGLNYEEVKSCKSSICLDFKSAVSCALGGIVGKNENNSKVSDSIFNGKINFNDAKGHSGGIVGNAVGGIISNCIMTGTIKGNNGEIPGALVGYFTNATIQRCIIDGSIIVNSGTPQYISPEYTLDKTVTKCYRTENATLTVGENTVDGSQGEIAILKPSEEIYTAEFFYETLLFNEDVWAIKPDGSGVHLKTLKE